MKRIILAILSLLFGALRGFYEGMIMTLSTDPMHLGTIEGVRGHAGFEFYHLIGAAVYAGFAALLISCVKIRPRWYSYIGIALLSWEAFELFYSFARTGVMPVYEHIAILDMVSVYLTGAGLISLHIARTIIGITLLCKRG